MCIALPMRVTEPMGAFALCEDGCDGSRREHVDLRLVGAQPAGTWVLVFLGAAREVIDAARAHRTCAALAALRAVQRGESIDHLFADLADREPRLPAHLRARLPRDDGPERRAITVDTKETEVPTP
jgi:hydrogenase expression/formation protein HypC